MLLRGSLQLGTPPLPQANRRDHQAENLGAFDFELAGEHMTELGGLNEGYSALGSSLRYA